MSEYFKKHKWHLVIFVILLLIVGISWKFGLTTQNDKKISNDKSQAQLPVTEKTQNTPARNASQSDAGGNNKTQTLSQLQIKNYKLQIITTSTVYDAIQKSNLDFKTKTFSGLGEFVEEIGGLKNDKQGGKYWIYFINGETAKLGISTQIVKPNDLIEWKYGNID